MSMKISLEKLTEETAAPKDAILFWIDNKTIDGMIFGSSGELYVEIKQRDYNLLKQLKVRKDTARELKVIGNDVGILWKETGDQLRFVDERNWKYYTEDDIEKMKKVKQSKKSKRSKKSKKKHNKSSRTTTKKPTETLKSKAEPRKNNTKERLLNTLYNSKVYMRNIEELSEFLNIGKNEILNQWKKLNKDTRFKDKSNQPLFIKSEVHELLEQIYSAQDVDTGGASNLKENKISKKNNHTKSKHENHEKVEVMSQDNPNYFQLLSKLEELVEAFQNDEITTKNTSDELKKLKIENDRLNREIMLLKDHNKKNSKTSEQIDYLQQDLDRVMSYLIEIKNKI